MLYMEYHNSIHVLFSSWSCTVFILFWDTQILWLESHGANGIYFFPVLSEGKSHGDNKERVIIYGEIRLINFEFIFQRNIFFSKDVFCSRYL